jgi:hypothetical protein
MASRSQRLAGFWIFIGIMLSGIALPVAVVTAVTLVSVAWLTATLTLALLVSSGTFLILAGTAIPALYAKDLNEKQRLERWAIIRVGGGTYLLGIASLLSLIPT